MILSPVKWDGSVFEITAGRIPVKLTDSADRPFWELADVVVILFGPKVKTRFKNLVLCSRHHLIFFSSVTCLLNNVIMKRKIIDPLDSDNKRGVSQKWTKKKFPWTRIGWYLPWRLNWFDSLDKHVKLNLVLWLVILQDRPVKDWSQSFCKSFQKGWTAWHGQTVSTCLNLSGPDSLHFSWELFIDKVCLVSSVLKTPWALWL